MEGVSGDPRRGMPQAAEVRFGSLADIAGTLPNVRFTPESRHSRAISVRATATPVKHADYRFFFFPKIAFQFSL
jgi:hypothetical protein